MKLMPIKMRPLVTATLLALILLPAHVSGADDVSVLKCFVCSDFCYLPVRLP
jgi:hypothetical protein